MTKLVIKYLTAPPTSVPSKNFYFLLSETSITRKTKLASTRESRNATFLPTCICTSLNIHENSYLLNSIHFKLGKKY